MRIALFFVAFVLTVVIGLPQVAIDPTVVSGSYVGSTSIETSGTYMKSKSKSVG